MTIDIDSTICEVHGAKKQGTAYGYTKVLGYHPLVATRADTGEILHIRQRKGSPGSGRGAKRFIEELVARVRRAEATGPLTLRADSRFFSWKTVNTLKAKDVAFSITVPQNPAVARIVAEIPDKERTPIGYTQDGQADVAETIYNKERLIVRRTRLTGHQAQLFPDWRYHAFTTNRTGTVVFLDADHRRHAVVELAIRDWKEGSAGNHCPSGHFPANATWTVLAALGCGVKGPIVTQTIRRRLITLPSRITKRSRRYILHLPTNRPRKRDFLTAAMGIPSKCGGFRYEGEMSCQRYDASMTRSSGRELSGL